MLTPRDVQLNHLVENMIMRSCTAPESMKCQILLV